MLHLREVHLGRSTCHATSGRGNQSTRIRPLRTTFRFRYLDKRGDTLLQHDPFTGSHLGVGAGSQSDSGAGSKPQATRATLLNASRGFKKLPNASKGPGGSEFVTWTSAVIPSDPSQLDSGAGSHSGFPMSVYHLYEENIMRRLSNVLVNLHYIQTLPGPAR